nr:phospholipase D family protein [uncultured Allomuricauda sp.]
MITFLNTEKLLNVIPDTIYNAQKELIIVVPFINLSNTTMDALRAADKKGVETTIICRFSEVKPKDRNILENLQNLNVFSHPNVHSKCYYNEESIVITSLNLTSYSERNNREMGVMVSRYDNWGDDYDDLFENEEFMDFADDLRMELQQLLNGSEYIIKSKRAGQLGYKCSLLNTNRDNMEQMCNELNRRLSPKRFSIEELEYATYIVCENYFDKITLRIKDFYQRIEFEPTRGEVSTWHNKFKPLHQEGLRVPFKGSEYEFKIYLNSGAKLNIVGYYDDLEFGDRLDLWNAVLKQISTFFTKELLKI